MKTISITVDEEVLARLDRLLEAGIPNGGNRSSLIREAMRAYVASMERRFEEAREAEVFRKRRAKLHQEARALVREQNTP